MEKKSTRIRKEEIILAALAVVGKKGMRDLTIAAIANSAGMSEANIYRHFSGKEEIFSALADFIGSSVMDKAATIAADSRKPLDKLETIFFSHMSVITAHPGIPSFTFSEDMLLGDTALSQSLKIRIGAYLETIAGIIAAGIQEGELKKDLSPRETALIFLGIIQFAAVRCTALNTDITVESQKLWTNFMKMIC